MRYVVAVLKNNEIGGGDFPTENYVTNSGGVEMEWQASAAAYCRRE